MRERAPLVSRTLEVESSAGDGTAIYLHAHSHQAVSTGLKLLRITGKNCTLGVSLRRVVL